MDQPDTLQKLSPKQNWISLTKIGAISAAVGGVSLHLMGQVTHRVYLYQMGISAGHFPKTTDWFVINGYYTLGERLLALMGAFFAHAWLIVLAILVLGIYMCGAEALGRWLRTANPPGLPQWVADMIRNLLLSTFVLVGIPIVAMFVMLIFLLPAAVGEVAGKNIAAKEQALFVAGCNRETSDSVGCSEITERGKVIATGYVIDASQSHIAIFDPVMQRATVMETAGKTIVGRKLMLLDDRREPLPSN